MIAQLKGKIAVVTAASRGIGLASTRALAGAGAMVVAGARSPAELENLERVDPVAVDLARSEAPASLVEFAVKRHGRVDVLVNVFGGGVFRADGAAVSDEEWEETLNSNLMSTVRACRSAVPHMITAGGGSIVNISSVNAVLADFGFIDYCTAKAALNSFSKSLSVGLAPHGIRVNTVSPGPVATRRWTDPGGLFDQLEQGLGDNREAVVSSVPLGRFAEPDEVAALVLMLASEAGAMVTGSDFPIDGGLIPVV